MEACDTATEALDAGGVAEVVRAGTAVEAATTEGAADAAERVRARNGEMGDAADESAGMVVDAGAESEVTEWADVVRTATGEAAGSVVVTAGAEERKVAACGVVVGEAGKKAGVGEASEESEGRAEGSGEEGGTTETEGKRRGD